MEDAPAAKTQQCCQRWPLNYRAFWWDLTPRADWDGPPVETETGKKAGKGAPAARARSRVAVASLRAPQRERVGVGPRAQ